MITLYHYVELSLNSMFIPEVAVIPFDSKAVHTILSKTVD